MSANTFDEDYYARHYADPDTRVASPASIGRLARFVCGYLDYLEIGVHEVIDFGCGVGLWREPLERAFPGVTYHGIETSAHACDRFGWTRGSVVDHDHGRAADLVICQGVLQYLDNADAKRAIRNLAKHTRGALYLEALTKLDWEQSCDQSRTDGDVHLRTGTWYRRMLAPDFISCGGGLFVPQNSSVVLFELERAG